MQHKVKVKQEAIAAVLEFKNRYQEILKKLQENNKNTLATVNAPLEPDNKLTPLCPPPQVIIENSAELGSDISL